MGRILERIGVLNLKPNRNAKKFCVNRINQRQQHSARTDHPFEGILQHHHMKEIVEGVHHKHFSLEQCHNTTTQRQHGKSNKIILPQHSTTSGCRQVKSTYFVRNLFHVKARQAPLSGNLKFYSENFNPNPISAWSSQISKGEPRGKITNKFRNKRNVEERSNSTGGIRTWGFS